MTAGLQVSTVKQRRVSLQRKSQLFHHYSVSSHARSKIWTHATDEALPGDTNYTPVWHRKLTQDQLTSFRELYNELAEDGPDAITPESLKQVLNKIDSEITEDESKLMFEDLDKNKNGQISFKEFIAACTNIPNTTLQDEFGSPHLATSNTSQTLSLGCQKSPCSNESFANRQKKLLKAISNYCKVNDLPGISSYYMSKLSMAPNVISLYMSSTRSAGLNPAEFRKAHSRMIAETDASITPYNKPLKYVEPVEHKYLVELHATSSLEVRRKKLKELKAQAGDASKLPQLNGSTLLSKPDRGWILQQSAHCVVPFPTISTTFQNSSFVHQRAAANDSMLKHHQTLKQHQITNARNSLQTLHIDKLKEPLQTKFIQTWKTYAPQQEQQCFVINPWMPLRGTGALGARNMAKEINSERPTIR